MNPLKDPISQPEDEDVYAFQIHRMKTMRAYPKDDSELIRIAKDHCGSILDLADVVRVFIEYAPECPQPFEFRGALDARKPPAPDQIDQWRKEGLKPDPEFSNRLLAAMDRKGTPEQYDTLRWDSIRNALEYTQRPERETDKQGRLFWNWYLAWAEDCHPQEVTLIRIGRKPTHPDPEAYKLKWENLPNERRDRILGSERLRTPPAAQEEIDRLKAQQEANRKERQP